MPWCNHLSSFVILLGIVTAATSAIASELPGDHLEMPIFRWRKSSDVVHVHSPSTSPLEIAYAFGCHSRAVRRRSSMFWPAMAMVTQYSLNRKPDGKCAPAITTEVLVMSLVGRD